MLAKAIQDMLEMAECFKANGDMELYRDAKATATKLLDYIMFVDLTSPTARRAGSGNRKSRDAERMHTRCVGGE